MNIIICGGRWVDSREPIHNYIDYLVERYGSGLTIITGGATGADTIAFEYAVGLGVNCAVYEADWTKCGPDCPPVHMKQNKRGDMYCPTAGLRRNKQMLEHPAHGVAAFIDRPLE